MSLIGSLEDLGLGDILQIISLSQKSGVLSIRGDGAEGRIVLRDGLVRGAWIKGAPSDLRGVLVNGCYLSDAAFDDACEAARRQGTTIEEAVAASTDLTPEGIDSLRRECVEAAVMTMFGWRSGEFSFDVRSELEQDDPALFLPTGINAQYLAMEGSRLEDESQQSDSRAAEHSASGDDGEPTAHEMFGVASPAARDETAGTESPSVDRAEEASAAEAVALATASRASEEADGPVAAGEAELVDDRAGHAQPPEAELVATPLVVIDSDLPALEWMKETLGDSFARIHIFQRWDLGLARIRQYLARAESPLVLLHPDVPGDPLSGIQSCADLVSRLKSQHARMSILWLQAEGTAVIDEIGDADGVVTRPSSHQLGSPRAAGPLDAIAARLRAELADALRRDFSEGRAPAHRRGRSSAEGLHRLKEATALLSDASTRGEVLPLVIRFAAESFSRVAMFMVRGDEVSGMAGRDLDRAGGPDDASLRRIRVATDGCSWFRTVLESRSVLRAPPEDGGDFTLAARLGDRAPSEAYVAPIESGGEIVALLYADNLPSHDPLGDTEALEVVLHHAGLALERAMLERALAEAETERS